MEEIEEAKDFAREKYSKIREDYSDLVILTFLASTGLVLFQHSQGWSWDFSVYSMIGSYIFHSGSYMEWLRPPVASVVIGLLQYVLPRRAAEYVFIALTSTFFLYASRKLSEKFDFSHEAFYIFLLTPMVIFFSSINGTEMLSLAFVMMFAADFQKTRSGLWLGLVFLTRYNLGLIVPLTLIQMDIVKTVKTGLTAGLTLLPWLIYNQLAAGSFLTSFGNFLMLNVFLRYGSTPLAPQNILKILFPTFLVLGLYIKPEIREKLSLNATNLFMAGYSGLIVLAYLTADYRSTRYLYPLILPAAFYGAEAWRQVELENTLKLLATLNIILAAFAIINSPLTPPGPFQNAAELTHGCMTESDAWTLINYAGTPSKPTENPNITRKRLQRGYRTIIFQNSQFKNFEAPVLEKNKAFTVYGYENRCKEPVKANQTYLGKFNERTGLNYTFTAYLYHRFVKDRLDLIPG